MGARLNSPFRPTSRGKRLHLARLCVGLQSVTAITVGAQEAVDAASRAPLPDPTRVDSSWIGGLIRKAQPLGIRPLPRLNAYSVWAGSSVATVAGSNNGRIVGGSVRLIAAQWTHDLFAFHRARISWITEVLPLILVTSGAPAGRTPSALLDPREPVNAKELARYTLHDAKGFGFSPLSAQAEFVMPRRLSTVIQVTSGVAWFSDIVPYGEASQGNFTVSPGIALQWDRTPTSRIAIGYTLHHTSNMTLARANPSLNAHMLLVRVTSRRAR